MIDSGPEALTEEGLHRSQELASHFMDNLVTMVGVARLDTTVTSMFLLAEVLACLEVYADLDAKGALRQVKQMTAARVAAIRAADADGCDCACQHSHDTASAALH